MTGAFVCFLKPYISIVTIPPPFLSLKTLNEGEEEGVNHYSHVSGSSDGGGCGRSVDIGFRR
ncbi:hypothetical protein HanHA300_Chr08g0286141 [Helianthus annuus]|nr:hypothetical protein HanHA300_Chr08g0286141 [Helianthus annuus]KAJ0547578.1 hypothetical protein HanIR_Chr08g0373751 [Helianthus annuus]KAJ0554125.1 hypothetical protein HanHA89_Chr08g0304151 [Helianthus annuus]